MQAGLFSAVSSAFIIDVQSKLEPDPNEMTAAYMRILIHTMNNSLFPDTNPSSTIWTGPPPEIVTVQSLLYASLATSLFAAFLAMLGKQWVNHYLRNHGGSTADKSRDRQRKLDGFQEWHFHLTIESLPVMLQLALLLLGCALSRYLWTINHTIAGVTITVTLFGVTSYIFLTLAATLYYNCPYQTPPSTFAQMIIRHLANSDAAFVHLLRAFIAILPPIKNSGQILGQLGSGVCNMLGGFGCTPAIVEEVDLIPVTVVVMSPARIFEDIFIDWEVCKADARCISWILSSTTDTDVIYSTVRFAADMVWYPEIMGTLLPHTLAVLFFDCLLDGQPIPAKLEHASSIGMALGTVLSTQLTIEPEDQALMGLCKHICDHIEGIQSSEPMFRLVFHTLNTIVRPPAYELCLPSPFLAAPDNLSITQRLWLSRIVLQTFWRSSCIKRPIRALKLYGIDHFCETFTTDGDKIPAILKTNIILIMTIFLGLQIDLLDLYAPNNRCVVPQFSHGVHSSSDSDAFQVAVNVFCQQLQISIMGSMAESKALKLVISTLSHLNPPQTMKTIEYHFLWLTGILNSKYSDNSRHKMASGVVQLIGKWFPYHYTGNVPSSWISPLLGFLSLCEEFNPTGGFTALHILSIPKYPDFNAMVPPLLMSILLPAHPLQSRSLALKIFYNFAAGWFSSQMEHVPYQDLDNLLQAVGDPFQFPDLPQDGQFVVPVGYKPIMVIVLLIEFASSDLWQNHLHHSNFTSCEEILSTEEGRKTALNSMLYMAAYSWIEFLCTPAKIVKAIRCLEELQCFKTAEVVFLWAWTVGVVNAADQNGWGLIEHNTLNFYQTYGIRHLATLSQYITNTTVEDLHQVFLLMHYQGRPCRVWSVQQLSDCLEAMDRKDDQNLEDLHIAQACQLRRLYLLFGYNPTTWKEVVVQGRQGDKQTHHQDS